MTVFEREVTVVGAGPAGSICASYLAKAGVDVLLLERDMLPRDKACGDMMYEGFVSHVEALGAARKLDSMSTCVRKAVLLSDDGHSTQIPFECYCAPRRDVDKLLADTAVSLGAELKENCCATALMRDRGRVTGVRALYRGKEIRIRSKLVIGADGAFSTTAAAAGLTEEKPDSMWAGERAYFEGVKLDRTMAKGQYDAYGIFALSDLAGTGFFWIVPAGRRGVDSGVCNVGFMIRDRAEFEKVDAEELFSDWLAQHPDIASMFVGAVRISPWRGGRLNDMSSGTAKAADGLMLTGEAAGLVMPLSNDGLSAAADSAKAAADAAVEILTKGSFAAGATADIYRKHLKTKSDKQIAEEMKEKRLLMESMHDPATMNKVVELLETDHVFRKKHLG